MHPVVTALTYIGITLVTVGSVLALGSFPRKKVTSIDLKNIQVVFESKKTKQVILFLSLKHESIIKGQIKATTGPFDFLITDFVDFPQDSRKTISFVITYYSARNLPREKPVTFDILLEKGNYMLDFRSQGTVQPKATLTLTATHTYRPFEKLLDVGLQLLEVGMPVLITGLVLSFGLPLT